MGKKVTLIGLIGLKGAGKDTCAKYLVDNGFTRLAFADKLYQEVAAAFNVSIEFLGNRETKESPRQELMLRNCQDPLFAQIVQKLKQNELGREFGLNEALSPRQVMQFWGTDYKRKYVSDSYWLDVVAQQMQETPGRYVITDVRFNNEADFIETRSGILVRVTREALERAFEKLDISKQHPSETELRHRAVFAQYENEEGNPDSLKRVLTLI